MTTRLCTIDNRVSTRAVFAACALAGALAGCEVTNPGPIQDQFLNDASSHAALVAGAGRGLLLGLNEIIYTTAVVAREVMAPTVAAW